MAQSDEFTGARARRQRSKSDTVICWSDKPDALTGFRPRQASERRFPIDG
jgi:hypothetical protein